MSIANSTCTRFQIESCPVLENSGINTCIERLNLASSVVSISTAAFLTSLHICEEARQGYVPVCKTLRLVSCTGLTSLKVVSTKIETLILDWCGALKQVYIDAPAMRNFSLDGRGGGGALESFKCIASTIEAPTLLNLDFSRLSLFECDLPSAVSLSVTNCKGLKDEHLMHAVKASPSLRELKISSCDALQNPSIESDFLQNIELRALKRAKSFIWKGREEASLRNFSAFFCGKLCQVSLESKALPGEPPEDSWYGELDVLFQFCGKMAKLDVRRLKLKQPVQGLGKKCVVENLPVSAPPMP